MRMRTSCCWAVTLCCAQIVLAAPNGEGKEIADRLGEDLSFASKQVIRGFTSIFAPLLEAAQVVPRMVPGGQSSDAANLQQVLFRDGLNAVGKGVKTTATILSTPARVLGTGLEEFRKVGQSGVESRMGADLSNNGNTPGKLDDRSKLASALLNTTSSQLSQANLGAVLVEVALKNRVKDIANRTATAVVPPRVVTVEPSKVEKRESSSESTEVKETTTSRVDQFIEQLNEAVKRNDERLFEALKAVIKRINPPKD